MRILGTPEANYLWEEPLKKHQVILAPEERQGLVARIAADKTSAPRLAYARILIKSMHPKTVMPGPMKGATDLPSNIWE